jgi:predicted HicB family RNase H-like nuclease
MKDKDEKKFLLRINSELKSKATKKAKSHERSLNYYINKLIEKDLN